MEMLTAMIAIESDDIGNKLALSRLSVCFFLSPPAAMAFADGISRRASKTDPAVDSRTVSLNSFVETPD